MKVIAFGFGKVFARFMLYREKYLPSLKILYVCDNDASLVGKYFCRIPVIPFEELHTVVDKVDAILITTSSKVSAEIADQIRGAHIKKKMYWLNESKMDAMFAVGTQCPSVVDKCEALTCVFDTAGPVLPYIECDIVDHCNLNCRGCGHASNIVPKGLLDVDVFKRDFERLAELYSNIEKIRLLGGEPLLHPMLTDFLDIARKVFPKATLCVATNGLLIPRMGEKVFAAMRDCHARFDITCYLPTFKAWRAIQKTLRDAHVGAQLSAPAVSFFKWFGWEHRNPKAVFADCGLDCTTICQGRISKCGLGAAYKRIAKKFGLKEENECGLIDIYEDGLDGWEVNERLKKPFAFCGYCRSVHNWQEKMLLDESSCFAWTCDGAPELGDWFQA